MKPTKNVSFIPLPVHGLDRRDNGANSHEEEFSRITNLVMENYQTFGLNDFYALSRGQDLPLPEVKKLFNAWTKKMLRAKRLKTIEGAYNEPIFVIL